MNAAGRAPLAAAFRARYPRIDLSLVSSEGYINLIERKVDIAIRAGRLDDSSLRVRHLFDSHHRLVAAPDYLARHGAPSRVADLDGHVCIGYYDLVQLTANNGEVIRRLCLEGNGIACLSDFMVDADIAAGRLVALLPEKRLNLPLPFHAVYYSNRAVSPKIRAFVDFLAAAVRQGQL